MMLLKAFALLSTGIAMFPWTVFAQLNAEEFCDPPGTFDEKCIQHAINSLPPSTPGQEIYVPAHTYIINAPISVDRAVTIRGAGNGTQLLGNMQDDVVRLNVGGASKLYGIKLRISRWYSPPPVMPVRVFISGT